MSEVDWEFILLSNDVNVAFDNFSLIFLKTFQKYFHVIEKRVKNKSKDMPWITPKIRIKKKELNRLKKICKMAFNLQW